MGQRESANFLKSVDLWTHSNIILSFHMLLLFSTRGVSLPIVSLKVIFHDLTHSHRESLKSVQ